MRGAGNPLSFSARGGGGGPFLGVGSDPKVCGFSRFVWGGGPILEPMVDVVFVFVWFGLGRRFRCCWQSDFCVRARLTVWRPPG